MGWTAPSTRSTGDLITASIWNVDLKDNLDYLKTKELWVPVTGGVSAGVPSNPTTAAFIILLPLTALNDLGYMAFRCPDNFLSLDTAEIIVVSKVTNGAANWDIYSGYGAEGEVYTTHEESDIATTYNVTDNQFFAVDVSGILSVLAVGDIVTVGLKLADATHDVWVIGFYMKYS